MSLATLLVVLLLVALLFGGWSSYPRRASRHRWGYYGWSPALLLVVVLVGHAAIE
jgi:hypothetical protein